MTALAAPSFGESAQLTTGALPPAAAGPSVAANRVGRRRPAAAGVAVAVCCALAAGALHAQSACRQALALGLDISGSVDAAEYRLQLDGLAGALLRPEVMAALLAMPTAHVDLAVYEWSGPGSQTVLQPWVSLRDAPAIRAVSGRLRAVRRGGGDPPTAIGSAMLSGAALLAARPACWRQVLDISGDGKSNSGPRPRDVRAQPALSGITVNALVIGTDAGDSSDARQVEIGELTAYFRGEVIHGDDAFVEVALGFADYERAMARKLLRELEVLAISLR